MTSKKDVHELVEKLKVAEIWESILESALEQQKKMNSGISGKYHIVLAVNNSKGEPVCTISSGKKRCKVGGTKVLSVVHSLVSAIKEELCEVDAEIVKITT